MDKIPILLIITSLALSCKTQQVSSLQLIQEKIGKEALVTFNEDNQYALIKQNKSMQQGNYYSTNYIILQVEDNTILSEGKVVNGYIKWIENEAIEKFESPGAIKETDKKEDYQKIIYISVLKARMK